MTGEPRLIGGCIERVCWTEYHPEPHRGPFDSGSGDVAPWKALQIRFRRGFRVDEDRERDESGRNAEQQQPY